MIRYWPDALPQRFDRTGYAGRAGDGRLRTKTATGPGKARLRSTAPSESIAGRMTARLEQILIFQNFLYLEIGGGTLPFLFPDPMGGLPILVTIGEDMPQWSNAGGAIWVLQLALEKLSTGTFEPGLPELPAGSAYLTSQGAYVVSGGKPTVVTGLPS